jgi:ABC-2 type transport system permease protein
MNAVQDPSLSTRFSEAFEGHPFLSDAAPTPAYLGWAGVPVLGLAGLAFQRRDL